MDLKCLPATTRRAVVTSTQLAPSYETEYFLQRRERMFATLRAVYGPSAQALGELQERFGATHLWIRRDAIEQVIRSGGGRWRRGNEPYGTVHPRDGERGRAGLAAPPAGLPPLAQRHERGLRHRLHRGDSARGR